MKCKVTAQTFAPADRKPRQAATHAARKAHSRVAYLVSTGKLVRPTTCEQCGAEGKTQGAHYNYAEPERVKWLCRSCHARWDWAEPKGGTAICEPSVSHFREELEVAS